ncbi:MAG: hypothetical protein RQ966_05820 [Acetobacteraceae bacterium]|nr:hypothetical protein [Acetobacteraceae bacterium]
MNWGLNVAAGRFLTKGAPCADFNRKQADMFAATMGATAPEPNACRPPRSAALN